MSRILNEKKKRLQYDRANLQRAFEATAKGMSVYRAARNYSVPESTLRDRTRGNVVVNAKIGFDTTFSLCEEKQLVDHIEYMASVGYSKMSIQHMAKELAVSLGKTVKAKDSFSNCWFYGLMKRWPGIKLIQPQKLTISRAKSASQETVQKYFNELSSILSSNGLSHKPERIYNIDETGINTEHAPLKIVCGKENKPQAITSTRSSTVTIIAGGNAIGNQIPPYYVFPGKRWNQDFLEGASPGSAGEMTESGWSNTTVFNNYLTSHFATHVNIPEGKDRPSTLILYDGHISHINLTLTDWAKKRNVILFVLPPHTSHLTQPLDVGVFGPLKAMYNKECHEHMRQNPGMNITKYHVAAPTYKPYRKALSAENLVSSFRKSGIYPFDRKVISDLDVAPAAIYIDDETEREPSGQTNKETTTDEGTAAAIPCAVQNTSTCVRTPEPVKSFFEKRTITCVKTGKPMRKFVPPFLAGNLLKSSNQNTLHSIAKKNKTTDTKKTACKPKEKNIVNVKKKKTIHIKNQGCVC